MRETLLVHAGDFSLVIGGGHITIAVQEVAGVLGVRVPAAAPGEPNPEAPLNPRLPREHVLVQGIAPGQVTRREIRHANQVARIVSLPSRGAGRIDAPGGALYQLADARAKHVCFRRLGVQ